MRIRVELKDPNTGKEQALEMDGPEMDPEELRLTVLDALEHEFDQDFPDDFDLKITEIAHGTIH
jgi:hypothetical protein